MESVLISSLRADVQQFIEEKAVEYNPNGNDSIDGDEIGKLLSHYDVNDISQLAGNNQATTLDYSQYPEALRQSMHKKLKKERQKLEEDLAAYQYDLDNMTTYKIDKDTNLKCIKAGAKLLSIPACVFIGFGAIDLCIGSPNLLKAYGKYACGLLAAAATIGLGALLGRGAGAIANHWRMDTTPYLKKVPNYIENIKHRLEEIDLEIEALKNSHK